MKLNKPKPIIKLNQAPSGDAEPVRRTESYQSNETSNQSELETPVEKNPFIQEQALASIP